MGRKDITVRQGKLFVEGRGDDVGSWLLRLKSITVVTIIIVLEEKYFQIACEEDVAPSATMLAQ